jgi:hypothetical protein
MATKKVLDFTQTKDSSGFSPKHKPEGEYLGQIITFEDTKSKSGNDMWVFGVQLKNDKRAVYPVYCLLEANQLWKLRSLMQGAGMTVPRKKISVDGNRLVGKEVGICLEDDEYEGKMKSVIQSFFPASEFEGTDTNEDDDADEADGEEEYEDEPEDEAPADSDDEGETDEDTEDEEEADEEEEEELAPAPAPKRRAPAGKTRIAKKPAPVEEDEDELDVDDL